MLRRLTLAQAQECVFENSIANGSTPGVELQEGSLDQFTHEMEPFLYNGIPMLKNRLQELPDSNNILIDFPDDGAWKQFHKQLQHFPMQEVEEAEDKEALVDTHQGTEPEPKEEEVPPLISTDQTEDLLGTYSLPFALTSIISSSVGAGQGLALGVLNLSIVIPQVAAAMVSGPLDAFFGGGNLPAFVMGGIAAALSGVFSLAWLST
ncbi:hypothetical protein ACSBR1_030571 [Camellia fascicularis]